MAGSGNHGDFYVFHDGRPPLAFRESLCLFFAGVHTPEFLAVRIPNAHEKMVVFPSPVFVKSSLALNSCFLRLCFSHWELSVRKKTRQVLSQGKEGPTSTK